MLIGLRATLGKEAVSLRTANKNDRENQGFSKVLEEGIENEEKRTFRDPHSRVWWPGRCDRRQDTGRGLYALRGQEFGKYPFLWAGIPRGRMQIGSRRVGWRNPLPQREEGGPPHRALPGSPPHVHL